MLATALIRGAFEYQGQKCSAASRAYVPRSLWEADARRLRGARPTSLTMGDVSRPSQFMGAVIDDRAFAKHTAALEPGQATPSVRVLTGGRRDDSRRATSSEPTVLECTDPTDEVFTTEYFGPILGVHVYDDARTTRCWPRPATSPRTR